jgi:hypothetical protein
MEELMEKLPRLKYLELRGHGDADLLDGQRWQVASIHSTSNSVCQTLQM